MLCRAGASLVILCELIALMAVASQQMLYRCRATSKDAHGDHYTTASQNCENKPAVNELTGANRN
jgi:hypothetical protein